MVPWWIIWLVLYFQWQWVQPWIMYFSFWIEHRTHLDDTPSVVASEGAERLTSPEFAPYARDGILNERELVLLLALIRIYQSSSSSTSTGTGLTNIDAALCVASAPSYNNLNQLIAQFPTELQDVIRLLAPVQDQQDRSFPAEALVRGIQLFWGLNFLIAIIVALAYSATAFTYNPGDAHTFYSSWVGA